MKMRELELRSGVGRETIRFYIREGLLPEPDRLARNVARYGETHVERLRTIKRLQDERFLPLDVIRRVLAGDPDAVPAEIVPFPDLAALIAARLGVAPSEPDVPLASLINDDPVVAADAEAFEALGIIRVQRDGAASSLSRLDAHILALWRNVRRQGYRPDAFPPDFIRTYADAAAGIAEVEVARFYEGLAGRVGEREAADMAQGAIETINVLIGLFRIRAILEEVAKRSPGQPPRQESRS
ncbi:MAG: MerR family transcriptional regulator [Alphaproteobacteria bacterium]|nr:MerR family transcriptional regulator [Alphaproteobacteria bacterium]